MFAMLRFSKLFVPLANRGLVLASLAGGLVVLACVSSQAQTGKDSGPPYPVGAAESMDRFVPTLSGVKPLPAQRVQWVLGPKKINLAGVVEFELPAGYKFADEHNARLFLEQLQNPVPKNLVGFMIPSTGEWFGLLELSEPGYVKDNDAAQIDAGAILAAIRRIAERQRKVRGSEPAPMVESVDWVQEPIYEPSSHRVEWAIRAASSGKAAVNYVVRHFGRRHVLDFVGVLPDKPELDLASLRKVAWSMSFIQGQRYEDFQAGDKVASLTLAQFVINQDQTAEELAAEPSGSGAVRPVSAKPNYVWLVAGFLGLFLAGVVVLVYRAWSRPRQNGQTTVSHKSVRAIEPVKVRATDHVEVTPGSEEKQASTDLEARVSMLGRIKARFGKTPQRIRGKRQKRYMYDKFYSRMIMRLSGSEYGNGGGNGDTEVLYNHAKCPLTRGVTILDFERELATKASALIETQTDLIEVQRKFIEEQRKLIEEQRRLIYTELEQAKNQLELFGK